MNSLALYGIIIFIVVLVAAKQVYGGGIFVGIANIKQWENLADKYAQIYSNLDPEEIMAIIWNESSGNAKAENPNDPSYGLMQVTIPIAQAYAGVTDPNSLFDPETNVKAGGSYLSHLKTRYADAFPNFEWVDAYNVGETQFDKGIRTQGYIDSFIKHYNDLKS